MILYNVVWSKETRSFSVGAMETSPSSVGEMDPVQPTLLWVITGFPNDQAAHSWALEFLLRKTKMDSDRAERTAFLSQPSQEKER